MRITEITYSLGRTIQVKNFEPVNFHASIKAEVKEKEDLNKAFDELRKIVQIQVKKDVIMAESRKDAPFEDNMFAKNLT